MESKAGDKEANFAKIEAFVERAAQPGARQRRFPDLCGLLTQPTGLEQDTHKLKFEE